MKIARMFERDITRNINGVVKVNETDEAVIFQELDEYVVTREILTHLRKVFSAYCGSLDKSTDKVGIWVSGFFGSGKSHFIKILSYLLENKPVSSGKVAHKPVEFFDTKIEDPLLLADIKRAVTSPVDVVLFNIDIKANVQDITNRDNVLKVFMKVFNEIQGFCADIPELAEMERFLASKDLYEAFKKEFKQRTGEKWEDSRDSFRLTPDEALEAFAKVTKQSVESTKHWFEDSEKHYSLSVEKFAKLVADYINGKGPRHRIVFLVDEVGQYIGQNTQLMLNLQSITEHLGTLCKGKAWVVVTSQEDMDAVLGEMRGARANDFSKIQGRFNTRISLSSANTDEVIKKRLLDKTPDASTELSVVHRKSRDILQNLLSFSADNPTMKTYENEQDFIESYPFVPYQFHLLQKVFESIRKAGASGVHLARGERSMLDSFQQAVLQVKDKDADILVPFYDFYAAIEGFLETVVVSTIKKAKSQHSLKDFDVAVLKTLFLIRYVDLVKPNVENIATLCVSAIDEDKLALKKKITESLVRLEKETLIQRNGDLYTFLTNEERDVMNEIKNVELDPQEPVTLLSELIYQDLFKDIRKHRFSGNGKDYEFNRVCDGIYRGASTADLSMEVISPLNEEYEQWNDSRCIMETPEGTGKVIFRLKNDATLGQELLIYKRTEKYIRLKSSASLPESTKRILADHSAENRTRKTRSLKKLEDLFLDAEVFTVGRNYEVEGTSSDTIRRNAFDYLIQNTYRKLDYLVVYTIPGDAERTLKEILTGHQSGQLNLDIKDTNKHPNCRAILEIQDFLRVKLGMNERVTVKDVAEKFIGRPWGWPDWDTVIMVAQLFRSNDIRLVKGGDPIDFAKAVEPMSKSRYWADLVVQKQGKVNDEERKKSIDLAKECFQEIPPSDDDELAAFIVKKVTTALHSLEMWKGEADYADYPTKPFLGEYCPVFQKLIQTMPAADLLHSFASLEKELGLYAEEYPLVEGFHTKQKTIFEQGRRFISDKKANAAYWDATATEIWQSLLKIIGDKRPYTQIPKIKGCVEKLTSADNELLDAKRKEILPSVGKLIAQLTAFVDEVKATDQQSNKALYPLQEIKKRIESATQVDAILAAASQAQSVFEESWKQLESLIKKGGAAKPSVKVQAAQFAKQPFLETTVDVDEFVGKLQQRLEAEIEAGNRIQIR
jgi:hypothetical protein